MRYTQVLAALEQDAQEAGLKVHEFVKAGSVIEKRQASESAARSSSPEEKASLKAFFEGLDGDVSVLERASMADLCRQANVRVNQGNSSVARHFVKQLLLTHRKGSDEQAA